MGFPGFRRLEHEVRFVADPCCGQLLDHRAHDQQHRYRRALGTDSAVAQDKNRAAAFDRLQTLANNPVQGLDHAASGARAVPVSSSPAGNVEQG